MKWHSFRKRKLPVANPAIYYFTPYNKSNLGTDLTSIIVLENGWYYNIILEKQFSRAGEYLLKKLLRNKDYIKKRRETSNKIGSEFLRFCRRNLSSSNLQKATDEELAGFLNKFVDFYEDFAAVNNPPWVFLADKLSQFLDKKLGIQRKENVVLTLSTPNFLTYTKREELETLDFAVRVKEGGISDFTELKEFKNLVKNHFWIPFDYLGPEVWDEKYYKEKINSLLGLELDQLKEKAKEIKRSQKEMIAKQREIIKELKLTPNIINLFDALKDIAILQDDKKAITTEAHYYLQQLFKEIASRRKINYTDFYYLLKGEIQNILLRRINLEREVAARKRLSIFITENQKNRVLAAEAAKKYAKDNDFLLPSQEVVVEAKEIKGIIGSPGFAVGNAAIVDEPKKMSKFREGKILVATMTTPDYVPIMKKAKAIVTDEGGITCHAAIVSRELKIPCVIGTKIATKILKNGDWVEVDANRGIVKILKR